MEHFDELKPVAIHFGDTLSKMLNTLPTKYLEIFHGAKVASFVNGHVFDTYLPNHPEDQKVLDEIGYKADEVESVVVNV
jgi:hypothetical protein